MDKRDAKKLIKILNEAEWDIRCRGLRAYATVLGIDIVREWSENYERFTYYVPISGQRFHTGTCVCWEEAPWSDSKPKMKVRASTSENPNKLLEMVRAERLAKAEARAIAKSCINPITHTKKSTKGRL